MSEPVTFFISWSTDAVPPMPSGTPCAPAACIHFSQNPSTYALEPPAVSTPSPAEPATKAVSTYWPAPVQLAIAVLILAAATALGVHALNKVAPNAASADRAQETDRLLNLNLAGEAELRLLPGVGATLAKRIVEHRQKVGKFRSVDDLKLVHGVGKVTFERLRSRVTVDESQDSEITDGSMASRPGRMTKTDLAEGGDLIDVNRASAAELSKIPGVGPVISQNIVDYRVKNGPFRRLDDLCKVPRIKAKTLEKIKPFITLSTDITIHP